MGALDSFSDYLSDLFTTARKRRKRKPMQTVEIKVKMDCDGCERKVKNAVSNLKGWHKHDWKAHSRFFEASINIGPVGRKGHLFYPKLCKHKLKPLKLNCCRYKCHKQNTLLLKLYLFYVQQKFRRVRSVDVNRKQSRVTVSGYVVPNKVLNKIKSTGKRAEFWPYVPYNLVAYPYVTQAYDKKAPSGYVKNVVQALPSPNAPEERFTSMFSDENPNACSIM